MSNFTEGTLPEQSVRPASNSSKARELALRGLFWRLVIGHNGGRHHFEMSLR